MRKDKTNFESPDRLNRIVEGTRLIGDLFADSNLRVDGEIKGNVSTSSKVVIGENGRILGNLSCLEADIEGFVDGKINVEGILVLRAKAKITGDIITNKIQIDEGALFNGKCQMGKISKSDQFTAADINTDSSVIY